MTEIISKEEQKKVYEIGYVLVSSIPEEKVTDVVTSLKDILTKKGAIMIAEENPELRPLAYTMIKKIGTQNHRFDQGYFGWMKFELGVSEIEGIKKTFELNPDMLRMLVMITVKENTYLGKKAPVPTLEVPVTTSDATVAPASVEELDKSIDNMVKGA